MDEFEFYFSFYGLLLGLSVATVVMRFADVVGELSGALRSPIIRAQATD